jgi:hypothetical protein
MSKQSSNSILRRLPITVTLTLLGLGAMSPTMQAAEGIARAGDESHFMLAATEGMDRRQDRRDVRQDCRQEEGVAGQDKRDCKQDGGEQSSDDNNDDDNVDDNGTDSNNNYDNDND